MNQYRQRKQILLIMGFIILGLVLWLLTSIFSSSNSGAKGTVEKFYQFEQDGNFSESWSLFHPFMQEKFSKGHYIQDRAHVFMNHFGVETFTYKLGKTEKTKNWKVTKDSPPFKIAYKVPVIQIFKGKYGNFSIQQDVYVVKEKKEWWVLWDYNQ